MESGFFGVKVSDMDQQKPSHANRTMAAPLRIYRVAEQLSQVDLATRAGVDPITIHRLENGGKPSRKTANSIAHVLGRPVEAIFPPEDRS